MRQAANGVILVVDDNPQALLVTTRLLQAQGFSASSAPSAAAALEELGKKDFDVVVTDIVMPGMSGIELLERVHGFSRDIPVILITGYSYMDNAMEAVKKGAFDFILKPFQAEQLASSVDRALSYRKLSQAETRYKHILADLNLEIETLMTERTMNMMALTVADRVRNPATVIGLHCRRLLEREELSGKAREGIEVIADEAGKLETIVREFQAFLKQKESLFTYDDINEVVGDVALIIESEAADKGIEVVRRMAREGLFIHMEKNLLKIALVHVARNAVEAMPEGGRVTVLTAGDGEEAVVEISDTGRGIEEEDLEKVFTPFFTTKQHRFGMGLSLIRQIVSEHGGDIGINSVPGTGTTVKMTFPTRWKEKNGR